MQKDRMSYDPRKKSSNAELICKVCKAIYQDKYWQPFAKLNPKNVDKLKKSVWSAPPATPRERWRPTENFGSPALF